MNDSTSPSARADTTAPERGTREWIARFIRTQRLHAQGASQFILHSSPDAPSEPPDFETAGGILAAIRERSGAGWWEDVKDRA